MKYKTLLTGTHQPLIGDFFNHMEFSFECLSSSTRTDDILGHLKYFQPDVLIYCLNKESIDDIRSFSNVFSQLSAKKIPLIVVGEQENCSEFEKNFPITEYLTIVRPFSTKNLEEDITTYLDAYYTKAKAEISETEEGGKNEKGETLEETPASIDKMVKEQNREQKEAPPKPADPERKKHILIVDDDSSVLKLVKRVLGDHYNVATAISGKVAMKFLENKETDLVLLDYEMPGESGAEVLQKIRSHEKFQKLPVVFLTGVTEKERIHEVLALTPQGYLLKPIDTERLNSTLEDILGKIGN